MDKNNYANYKIEDFIKSLTDEEYLELINKISNKGTRFDNNLLIGVDLGDNSDNYTLNHVYYDDFKKIKKIEFNTFSKPALVNPPELNEVKKLHYINSEYETKWMYPSILCNTKLAHMEMLLHGIDFIDQIDSEHEQYSYFFNMQRDNVGLPRIELKIGSLYELQLGKKRDIIKSMTLVDIKGGLESNKIPELYFENDKTFYNESGHRTNISHIKIWKEIKGK